METFKSCIILGVSIEADTKLYVLHEILTMIKMQYSDCKVFIGINYGCNHLVEAIIDSYELNSTYERLLDQSLHTASDDSAYQLALKLFYADPTRYDVCWFVHTKGGFNSRDVERHTYIHDFFGRRDQIESKFQNHEYLGVYGYRAGEYWIDHSNPVEPHITNSFMHALWSTEPVIDDFTCEFCHVIIVETMFALNAKLMYKFLDRYSNFFDTKLRRYFFECEISNFLSTRSGYYQGLVKGNWATGASMQPMIDEWISKNQLTYLETYKQTVGL